MIGMDRVRLLFVALGFALLNHAFAAGLTDSLTNLQRKLLALQSAISGDVCEQ